ncbi:hypothetical protein [Luteitalea pratensis]|uniref:hypothetical protein n=1 Tax=Luteitalea pratensis TaxID=1855912 RepID=UPI000D72F67F|nr:hypothetical protein [Luteitalea pratensis]
MLRRTLLGSAPQGKLRLIVDAVPRSANGKTGSVSVTVLADGGDERIGAPVDVVLATFDDEGRATNQHQVRLDSPPAGQPLEFTTECLCRLGDTSYGWPPSRLTRRRLAS